MKYTDPSGFFFHKLFKKIRKWIKPIVTIAVSIVVGIATAGAGFGIIAAGFASGFAGGFTGTLLNGGSFSDAFKSGLKDGFWGAVSAGVAWGVAEISGLAFNVNSDIAHDASFFHGGRYGLAAFKTTLHGLTRAAITRAQGGRFSAGFWSGVVASGFAAPKGWGIEKGTMFTAIMSGTVSEISGGKFANGAVTGAFVHLFNASYKYLQTANDAKALNNSIGYAAENPVGERKINSHGDLTWGEVAVSSILTVLVVPVRALTFAYQVLVTRPLETIATIKITNDLINESSPIPSTKKGTELSTYKNVYEYINSRVKDE